jgi:hypothetical protein
LDKCYDGKSQNGCVLQDPNYEQIWIEMGGIQALFRIPKASPAIGVLSTYGYDGAQQT